MLREGNSLSKYSDSIYKVMSGKKISRKKFLNTATSGLLGAAVGSVAVPAASTAFFTSCDRLPESSGMGNISQESFGKVVEKYLPVEDPYTFHKKLSEGAVHLPRRDYKEVAADNEISLSEGKWSLAWKTDGSPLIDDAVSDLRDYLEKSMDVIVDESGRNTLENWEGFEKCIIAGTREQLPGCGLSLRKPKDYEIQVTPSRITVCGYDERGTMFGLYNLEARMNLRGGPYLPNNLKTVRHSLYDVRLVHSWMGWMEWPDNLLSRLAHDGFDGIYASAMANPNGDRTTAETSTDFYARILYRIRNQSTEKMHDLIKRAGRYGIKVYTPIIYQYLGTPASEAGLRKLVRDILKEFPDISGYILLTEGFWYKKWGGGHGADRKYMEDWAQNWSYAVGVVAEECHRVNPSIEILPWEYNIDFRPQNVDMKRYFIRKLPQNTIPLLTWENGKSFEIDGMQGYLRDYAISQTGPAEVTSAQIEEARKRGMKVYTNADTFVCGGQFQTVPYHPFPYQWYERYKGLEKYGVNGTLESWTSGYNPNFMTEFRSWYCWSDAPRVEELLGAVASRIFGESNSDKVNKAWDLFSQAIRLVPDTGPTMGTSNSIGNPLFFREPPLRTTTFRHSWTDHQAWMGYMGGEINPYWPFTVSRLTFTPDFSNNTNRAENYARSTSGVQVSSDVKVLPVFLKYLGQAAEKMEQGLKFYREAAFNCPEQKKQQAVREVVVAEQILRMIQSEHAILEFENLRLEQAASEDKKKSGLLLDRMEDILREEIKRTELSLHAASRDSRLGFQQECDYVYTPYSLKEKLEVLNEILYIRLPESRDLLKA
jgi:hypothetical protein